MIRSVTRRVANKGNFFTTVTFVFSGLNSSQASRLADMLKFNMEKKRGLHNDPRSPGAYKKNDFAALPEHEVITTLEVA